MRTKKRKRFRNLWSWTVFGFLLGVWIPTVGAECDCLPRFSTEDLTLRQIEQNLLLEYVFRGDFEIAESLLRRSPNQDSPFGRDLLSVLDQYFVLQKHWQQQDQKHYQQLLKKIESLRAAAREKPPSRPDRNLAIVLQARELTGQEEPNLLDTDPFVSLLIHQIQRKLRNWESRGEYEKALRFGLLPLMNLDPKNTQLKERKVDLLDKMTIESNLNPHICPDQENPYLKVRKDVFFNALRFLEISYVKQVDFSLLTAAAIRHAKVLGEVLTHDREAFLYSVDPNDLSIWKEQLLQIEEAYSRKQDSAFTAISCIEWIWRILELNEQTLQLPEGFVIYGMAEAVLAELDPYTQIVWPSQTEEFDKRMTGEFAGIGVRITRDENKIKIVEVVEGTPAEESGLLRADDWIKAVDGQPSRHWSLECAVRQISGPEGTDVVLTIVRGDQEQDVTIERRKITMPTLQGTTLKQANNSAPKKNKDLSAYRIDRDERIGYIWISSFGPKTAQTLRAILEQLEEECLVGLILDLRANAGGLLHSAAAVADLFLTEGLIVKSRGRRSMGLEYKADSEALLKAVPMVVLVDEGSASGAEIVAGALTAPDHQRAILVGKRTYGKGSIQEIDLLSADGSRIKYTRAYYVLSGDRLVPDRSSLRHMFRDDWGIRVDVEVDLHGYQISEIYRNRRKLEKFYADFDASNKAEFLEKEYALLDSLVRSDPQLATGLTILKAKILSAGIPLLDQPQVDRFVHP